MRASGNGKAWASISRSLFAAAAAMILSLGEAGAPATLRAAGPPRDILVVLNKSDNTASVIDVATKQTLATISVGFGPHEAEVLPGGRVVAVSNYGTADKPGESVSVIDLETMAEVGTVFLAPGSRPHGLKAISGNRLLVTAEGAKELVIAEPLRRRVVSRISLGREGSHMVVANADATRAFVSNIGSGSVTVVDLLTEKVAGEIPTGEGAEGLDLRPGSGELWVANRGANTISIVDTKTLAVVATLPAKESPIRVKFTPDGRRALVSCSKSGNVAVFDASRRKEIRRVSLDHDHSFSERSGKSPTPVGILIAPDGRRAWVASTNADVVSVLDLERLQVVDRIVAGHEPDGLAGAFHTPSR